MAQKKNEDQLKTIGTIALLVSAFFIPLLWVVGIVMMWMWMKWNKWLKILITVPFVVLIASMLGLLIYVGIARPVQIKGETMSPNFVEGQYYMTNVISENEPIKRGDVVIFTSPESNAELVKRVIALPNEKVLIESGVLSVNDEPLDESVYISNTVTTAYKDAVVIEGESYTVPANSYFVLGDNRSQSSDSRVWGAVPATSIKSKIGFCYWNCWK